MKPPKKLKLAADVWKLQFGKIPKEFREYFYEKDVELVYGCTNRSLMTIWIDTATKYDKQLPKRTMLHEITHAMVYTFSFEHLEATDEKEIERLSGAIYAFLMQNKPLIKWLIEEE